MKRTIFIFTAVLFCVQLAVPAGAEIDEATKKAVTQVAMDYMDGALDGDAVRVEKAIHPELTKIAVGTMTDGTNILRKSGYSMLIELVRAGAVHVPEDLRTIEVEIFSVHEGIASVKVTSSVFCDYLHIAEINGEWKLVNVLWKMHPEWVKRNKPETLEGKEPVDPEVEKKGIEAAAMDYIEGYFTGDADRMAKGVHPELTKVTPRTIEGTGKQCLGKIGAEYLIEVTRTGSGKLDEDKRNIEMTILDFVDDIATVEVLSTMFFDYLQVAKINGEWKIVNVLWVMNPLAPTE